MPGRSLAEFDDDDDDFDAPDVSFGGGVDPLGSNDGDEDNSRKLSPKSSSWRPGKGKGASQPSSPSSRASSPGADIPMMASPSIAGAADDFEGSTSSVDFDAPSPSSRNQQQQRRPSLTGSDSSSSLRRTNSNFGAEGVDLAAVAGEKSVS
jgi:hypothetical protein